MSELLTPGKVTSYSKLVLVDENGQAYVPSNLLATVDGLPLSVGVVDKTNEKVNPATEDTILEIKNTIEQLLAAVDEVEQNLQDINTNTENIDGSTDEVEQRLADIQSLLSTTSFNIQNLTLNAETLNLNTDELEGKLDEIKSVLEGSIDVDLDITGLATETTTASILIQVGNVTTKIEKCDTDNISGTVEISNPTDVSALATETTLNNINTTLSTNITDILATEAGLTDCNRSRSNRFE